MKYKPLQDPTAPVAFLNSAIQSSFLYFFFFCRVAETPNCEGRKIFITQLSAWSVCAVPASLVYPGKCRHVGTRWEICLSFDTIFSGRGPGRVRRFLTCLSSCLQLPESSTQELRQLPPCVTFYLPVTVRKGGDKFVIYIYAAISLCSHSLSHVRTHAHTDQDLMCSDMGAGINHKCGWPLAGR